MRKVQFVLLTALLAFFAAPAHSQRVVATISGTHTDLRSFPVEVDGQPVLMVYLKYVGTSPEDTNSRGAKSAKAAHPTGRVDYYRMEIENLTSNALEIYEVVSSVKGSYVDGQGRLHESPPKTYRVGELREAWGADGPVLDPHERWLKTDQWIWGDHPLEGSTVYRVRNLDKKQTFAFEVVLRACF